ncbi:hypothetical protein Pmani_033581 [Petrolisthes manimaculis]|uniref:Uncharacterized protein n=1 Tax=Petrolisthes manimaculis TaxID=1843537 RepID=A0AAE1NRL1_9EUCA|nr:hypothetical protein Pmani_033581 [Petrolisthes manimaculis]
MTRRSPAESKPEFTFNTRTGNIINRYILLITGMETFATVLKMVLSNYSSTSSRKHLRPSLCNAYTRERCLLQSDGTS